MSFMIVPKMFYISMYKNFHVLLLSYKYYKSGTNSVMVEMVTPWSGVPVRV
jgi:hypothetical protein